jgi:hypothetical protein
MEDNNESKRSNILTPLTPLLYDAAKCMHNLYMHDLYGLPDELTYDKSKHYTVLMFYSFKGKPLGANYKILAYTIMLCRRIRHPYKELRIIDNKTGEHIFVW